MSSTATIGTSHILDDNEKLFLDRLSNYWEVEIGIVTQINDDGTATVQSYIISDNIEPIIWERVELIHTGCVSGGIKADVSGSTCLLFRPRTALINSNTQEVNYGGRFDKSGIKALPFAGSRDYPVSASIRKDGSWCYSGSSYSIIMSEKQLTLQWKGSTVFCANTEGFFVSFGTYSRQYYTTGEIAFCDTIYSSAGKPLYVIQYKTDGSVMHTTYDSGNNVVGVVTKGTDGSLTITDGNNTLVNLKKDALTIKVAGTVTINDHLTIGQ